MARPRSEDKRNAIMAAATRVVVAQGLGAPTALIAKEAGVANGSLFTYFPTKADLFNQLYLALKTDMALATLKHLPTDAGCRNQMCHLFCNWVRWAASHPDQWRALAQLGVSDDITPATRTAGHETMASVRALVEQSRANGPMRDAPMGFVVGIMTALAGATIEFVAADPGHGDEHCKSGFDALWRAIA